MCALSQLESWIFPVVIVVNQWLKKTTILYVEEFLRRAQKVTSNFYLYCKIPRFF